MTDKLDKTTIGAQYAQARADLTAARAALNTAQQSLNDATASVRRNEDAIKALTALYQSLFGADPA